MFEETVFSSAPVTGAVSVYCNWSTICICILNANYDVFRYMSECSAEYNVKTRVSACFLLCLSLTLALYCALCSQYTNELGTCKGKQRAQSMLSCRLENVEEVVQMRHQI